MTDEEIVVRLTMAALVGMLARVKEGSYEDIADAALRIARRLARRIKDEGALPP